MLVATALGINNVCWVTLEILRCCVYVSHLDNLCGSGAWPTRVKISDRRSLPLKTAITCDWRGTLGPTLLH